MHRWRERCPAVDAPQIGSRHRFLSAHLPVIGRESHPPLLHFPAWATSDLGRRRVGDVSGAVLAGALWPLAFHIGRFRLRLRLAWLRPHRVSAFVRLGIHDQPDPFDSSLRLVRSRCESADRDARADAGAATTHRRVRAARRYGQVLHRDQGWSVWTVAKSPAGRQR